MADKEYIEREAALKQLADLECRGGDDRERDIGNWLLHEIAPKHIRDIPAADVVEVRHGEWVAYETEESYGCEDDTVWYKCSVCCESAFGRCYDDEWYSSPLKTNYCPNCGAKMDGKGEGE